MKSALRIVAFANRDSTRGAIALLEVALEALDAERQFQAGAHVSHALHLLQRQVERSRSLMPDEHTLQ